jgi:hypothetical protein
VSEALPHRKLNITLGGQPIDPWWNMVALAKLKKEYGVTMQEVMNNILDPDNIVPFYWVGLESRSPGTYTMDQVREQLDFYDLMVLQSEMSGLIKVFGLDAVPLPTGNGAKPGPSLVTTSG